jgi:predicted MFS family arabinose efflux permease
MYGLLFYLTLYLQRVHGDSPAAAGAALLPLTAASGIAAPTGGALARRIPLRPQLCAGLLLVTAGTLGLATLGARAATLASQQAMTSGLRTALVVIAAVTAAASLSAVSLITSAAPPRGERADDLAKGFASGAFAGRGWRAGQGDHVAQLVAAGYPELGIGPVQVRADRAR